MSVVAAAVGPAGALAPYGPQQLCGSGARKRKDVVLLQGPEAVVVVEEEESRRPGDGDFFLAAARQQQQQYHGLFVLERVDEEEVEEEERSSIGAASEEEDRDHDEDGDEADSAAAGATTTRRKKMPDHALACMDALDDALPIKRGLSNFFSGKSRSFANLQDAEVASARDLAKPESPFNKRRRILRCSSIRRVASTSLTALPPFLPTAGNDGGDSGVGG